MTWLPRISGKNMYHHIYAWGNDRHPIFKEEAHYMKYCEFLKKYSAQLKIDTIAYALMEWHVHLFIYDRLNRISDFMLDLHGDYARYYNRLTNRVGHVFGERFNNKIVQLNNYGIWLSRYIHRQPIEAGLVSNPEDYPWTSYRIYIGLEPNWFLKPEIILEQFGVGTDRKANYEKFVRSEGDGPIDWDKSTPLIAGDYRFRMKMKKLLKNKVSEGLRRHELIKIVCEELNAAEENLLNPVGKRAKDLRRKAFVLLVKKYNCTQTQVAHAFKVTRLTVMKALKK